VREGLDFEISDKVYEEIDHAMTQLWNAVPIGAYMHSDDIKNIIRALRSNGILLSEAQIHAITHAVLYALEAAEYVEHAPN